MTSEARRRTYDERPQAKESIARPAGVDTVYLLKRAKREDHEDEGRAHPPRAQNRARRRSRQRGVSRVDAARGAHRRHNKSHRHVITAVEQGAAAANGALTELVADKGYPSNQTLSDLRAIGVRSYVLEPPRGRRRWATASDAQRAVHGHHLRMSGGRGQRLLRRRGGVSGAVVRPRLR